MKLLSSFNFNEKKEILQNEISKHGKDNVFIVDKSRLFYYLNIFFPSTSILCYIILITILYFSAIKSENSIILSIIFGIISTILLISFAIPTIKKYIDYTMDFIVVTPEYIMKYDQEGLFKKHVITINTKNIKTITTKKGGLFNSLFNEGEIIILCEGDEIGKISVSYIEKPEKTKSKISHIISENLKHYQISSII